VRKIIHVDMDAFYASVEQRDNPELRSRPVAVGGSSHRGVVMAASYEARVFGVRSAMPSVTAARRCPDLIFVRPRFDVYKEASEQIRAIFRSYTDLVEPLALDEAYLDVTGTRRGPPSATLIARAIKAEVRQATELTASAGVSFNKFLAKIASDMDKPDGLYVIRPEQADAFIRTLPIERFFGVGPVTARKMLAAGIRTGADLLAHGEAELVRRFGSAGAHYRRLAEGLDEREVRPNRPSKSIGAERTFAEDLTDPVAMLEALRPIADKIRERAEGKARRARTLTLKIKHSDFTIQTRSRTVEEGVALERLMDSAERLLRLPATPSRPVRLLGLSLSNFVDGLASPSQLTLRF
jgi:DNA polymerase-4